ncbi:hypothetical protein EV137_2728 [Kribbella pratensis]|uniref:Uncharacterized protein n=1 Tax=Kribbella pratensis TaxID=2512112 RepID=A0ABY2FQG8_9ACTN|nr:hypothetical protein EV137_2728 [Kribbella pratensis]
MSISRRSVLIVVAISVLALVLLLFIQSFLLLTVVAAGAAFAVGQLVPPQVRPGTGKMPLQRPPLWGLLLLGGIFLVGVALSGYVALGGGAGTQTVAGWIGVVFLSCLGAFITVVLRKVDQGASC